MAAKDFPSLLEDGENPVVWGGVGMRGCSCLSSTKPSLEGCELMRSVGLLQTCLSPRAGASLPAPRGLKIAGTKPSLAPASSAPPPKPLQLPRPQSVVLPLRCPALGAVVLLSPWF